MPAPAVVVNNAAYDHHFVRMPIDRIITGLCSIIVKHDTATPDNDDAVEEYFTNWGSAVTVAITGTAASGSYETIITTASDHGWSNGTVVYIPDTTSYRGAWAISSASGSVFTIQTPYTDSQSGNVYTEASGSPPIGSQYSAPFYNGQQTADPGRTGYGLRLGDQDVFLFSVTASVHLDSALVYGTSHVDPVGYTNTSGTWYESINHPRCQSYVRSTLLSRHNNAYGMATNFYKHGVDIIAQSAHTLTAPAGIHGHSAANGLSDIMHNGMYSDENDNFEVDLSTQTNNTYFTPVYDVLFEAEHALSLTSNPHVSGGTDWDTLYQLSAHPTTFYNLAIKIKLYSFDKDGDRNLSVNAGTDATGGTQTTHFRNRTNVFWQPFGETAELQFNKAEYTS